MLAAAKDRPRSWASFLDVPIEDELMLTRQVAARLWRLLERRDCAAIFDFVGEAYPDARAAADRTFEAAMLLLDRHGIVVEPCRQLLDRQRDAARQYVLKRPNGDTEIVEEQQLLMMAGFDV